MNALKKMLKTDVSKYISLPIFNLLSQPSQMINFMMHPAKKGINLVHCLAYIGILCFKGCFFLIVSKLQKSLHSTAKMADFFLKDKMH